MTKTEIMKEAHRIAREELEGDYQAKLSLALKMVWEEAKEMKQKPVIEDWWLQKNPAKETILNEFDLEVEAETENAINFNDKIWVPKSVIKWEKVSEEELADEEKKEKFLENYKDADWYDRHFRREVRKNRGDRDR